jgi:hypothetical protein
MEDLVIKHTKKAHKIWSSKEHPFWVKLKEFLIEILIIVFAVTLSIWFHSWSEHNEEQKQVKIFLLGLKKDINADIQDSKAIIDHYRRSDTVYAYLSGLSRDKKANPDSLKLMIPQMFNTSFLRPHLSRFNGFLSAGKIMTIEEDSLALQILNYYQETIPALQTSEAAWTAMQNNLTLYLVDNIKDNTEKSYWEVLTTPKAKFLTEKLISWDQLIQRYNNVIKEGETIIMAIDKLYPGKE